MRDACIWRLAMGCVERKGSFAALRTKKNKSDDKSIVPRLAGARSG
jgi:hypothetical protein